jgi:hypothetical protein
MDVPRCRVGRDSCKADGKDAQVELCVWELDGMAGLRDVPLAPTANNCSGCRPRGEGGGLCFVDVVLERLLCGDDRCRSSRVL